MDAEKSARRDAVRSEVIHASARHEPGVRMNGPGKPLHCQPRPFTTVPTAGARRPSPTGSAPRPSACRPQRPSAMTLFHTGRNDAVRRPAAMTLLDVAATLLALP
jgi:hypothetical protein